MIWIISCALALLFAWFLLAMNDVWIEGSVWVGMFILALILVWPIHWVIEAMNNASAERASLVQARQEAWLASMRARDCKVTSFVGTKSSITPVWTCADGSAHLQEDFR